MDNNYCNTNFQEHKRGQDLRAEERGAIQHLKSLVAPIVLSLVSLIVVHPQSDTSLLVVHQHTLDEDANLAILRNVGVLCWIGYNKLGKMIKCSTKGNR